MAKASKLFDNIFNPGLPYPMVPKAVIRGITFSPVIFCSTLIFSLLKF
jgi:hypothetical protein